MNRSSARLRPLLGAALALGVAAGVAVAANGATGEAARDAASVVSQTAPVSSLPSTAECTAMGTLAADAAGAAASSGAPASVHALRGRAAAAARTTSSDDVREATQNLADDLAALRVALATVAGDPAEAAHRRADIEAVIRGDVAAMRRLCGR